MTADAGILTFLFTDLENSSRLWENFPELMQDALARHDALLHAAFEAHAGRVVKTTGDGFHVVFDSPSQGIAAALAAQQALDTETWPQELGLFRVRMGLHSGESQARAGDYYGPELNRAARLMGIGHGGQVLVSGTTAALLRGRLPADAALLDLGQHRLRGLSEPEQVFQLAHPSLERDFPTLQSAVLIPHNLPGHLTTFIGRTDELEAVRQLLESHRLLTLLGPGGTGKTRLMLQAAGDLVERFPDGVWLVELAPLTDPELVAEKTAAVLGVRGQPDRPLADSLAAYLRRKEMLLLLDNAEHLIRAAAELAEYLVAACPHLKILVTSREPLAIEGEAHFQVPSLSLPAEGVETEVELAASEAVQLFLDRARTVRPDFELSGRSVPAVAGIVRDLDGIPMALELAAARLRVMTAEQIATRLNDRFRLLVGGRRTALPRQQTLQALIDWSWNLLEEKEQILLRRLSVFSGGWALEDAQAVAGEPEMDPYDVLDNLEALVQKSLVASGAFREGSGRFHLLETIRQYARERLSEAGEAEMLGDRHAAHFAGLIDDAEQAATQKETVGWIQRLVRETDNYRAAFDWLETRDPMLFLSSAGRLMVLGGQGFWSFSPPQAARWLARAIEIARALDVPGGQRRDRQQQLGLSLAAMGSVTFALGRHKEGATYGEEAVSLLRPFGDTVELAYALGSFAFNLNFLGRSNEAYEAGLEARQIARSLEDGVTLFIALGALGMSSLMRGDIEKAREYLAEGKAGIDDMRTNWLLLQILMMEGRMLANTGELARAEAIYREADRQFQELGERTQAIMTRSELAHALRGQGKWDQALPLYRETILFFQDMGHEPAVANQLECFAYIAIAREAPQRAARLLGAAQAIRARTHNPIHLPWEKSEFDQALVQLDAMLGSAVREEAFDQGRGMSLEEAVTFARTGSME